MLDDHRSVPGELPADLGAVAGLPLANPYFWPAFTYQGAHAPAAR